jgi:signal peptidase
MTSATFTPTPTALGRAGDWANPRERAVRRVVFRLVLAVFVVAILASYALPLWFQLQGDRLLVVTSGSMEPEIKAGDAVVIRPVTDASQLRPGQVITFIPVGTTQLVTHRIESLATVTRRGADDAPVLDQYGEPIRDAYVKTKGDANDVVDPNLTPASQVRGIVREIRPGLGWFLWWAHSPFGRLVLFAPPLLMLLTAEILSRLPEGRAPWSRRTGTGSDGVADQPQPTTAQERDHALV